MKEKSKVIINDVLDLRQKHIENTYDSYMKVANIFTFLNIFGLFCSTIGVVSSTIMGLNNSSLMIFAYLSYFGIFCNAGFFVVITDYMNKKEYKKIMDIYDACDKNSIIEAKALKKTFLINKKNIINFLKKELGILNAFKTFKKITYCLNLLIKKTKVRDTYLLKILYNLNKFNLNGSDDFITSLLNEMICLFNKNKIITKLKINEKKYTTL